MRIGAPAIWIQTQDFQRVIDNICAFPDRTYYSMVMNKFCIQDNGKWKPILIDIPDPEDASKTMQVTTGDLSVALEYLYDSPVRTSSTFIYQNILPVDQMIKMVSSVSNLLSADYRHAFMQNDSAVIPYQFIVVSPFVCPEEYKFLFINIEDSYPNLEQLIEILIHMNNSTNGSAFEIEKSRDIAKAGLGLSESSFINLCMLSMVENGSVDAGYVYSSKMSNIKKHGILEIVKPKITFDSIGGLDNIKQTIAQNVYFWENPDEAEKFGIAPIRRILTVGVPGTGKSAICEATANALGLDLARTGVSQVMNSFVGQSEANMRAVFQQIRAMAPLCVWIDEFGRDLSGGASSSHVDGGTTDRVHGEFLTGLQELPDDVFLMCAANQLDNLRPEMLRAERFDKIFFVGLPSFEERIQISRIYLPEGDHDHEQIAHATKYFTGAEIKTLIKQVKFDVVSSERRHVTTSDIISYAPRMRNILWNKDRDMIRALYRTAYEQWDWSSSLQLTEINDILDTRPQKQSSFEPKF
jgi:AAA+ superfamily predicted ATPase